MRRQRAATKPMRRTVDDVAASPLRSMPSKYAARVCGPAAAVAGDHRRAALEASSGSASRRDRGPRSLSWVCRSMKPGEQISPPPVDDRVAGCGSSTADRQDSLAADGFVARQGLAARTVMDRAPGAPGRRRQSLPEGGKREQEKGVKNERNLGSVSSCAPHGGLIESATAGCARLVRSRALSDGSRPASARRGDELHPAARGYRR